MPEKYDTKLSKMKEQIFQEWLKEQGRERDLEDYDWRGHFQDVGPAEFRGPVFPHAPDTYKKPSHPTFSEGSKYHGVAGNIGGRWGRDQGRDYFAPGRTNPDRRLLEEYFKRFEPNNELR
jgi:hypothetical protein